jgi:predicted CopG family antitoxin
MAIKTVQINLTEEEYDDLSEIKGKQSWRDFLLSFVTPKNKK